MERIALCKSACLTSDTVFIDITANSFHFLVSTGTKRFVSRSRQNDNANIGTFPTNRHGIRHLTIRLRTKRDLYLREGVNRYLRDSIAIIEKVYPHILNRFPIYLFPYSYVLN